MTATLGLAYKLPAGAAQASSSMARFRGLKPFFEHVFANIAVAKDLWRQTVAMSFLPLRREQSQANITIRRNGVRALGLSVEDPLFSCLDGLVLRMLAAQKLLDRRVSAVAEISGQSDLRH